MIIGLTGYAQSGKDTVAKYLAGKGYKHLAFADPLRELALSINPTLHIEVTEIALGYAPKQKIKLEALIEAVGYEKAEKNPAVMEFYQNLGQAMRNWEGDDYWVEATLHRLTDTNIDLLNPQHLMLVISDVRYKNEAKLIKDLGGVIIKVTRPTAVKLNDHPSEEEITTIDGTLRNEGTIEELYEGVDFMLKYLGE
jgi:hypothetical protein